MKSSPTCGSIRTRKTATRSDWFWRKPGSNGVVLGSDYPVTAPDLGMEYVQSELDALDLSPEVRRKIERDNALTLLGLTNRA